MLEKETFVNLVNYPHKAHVMNSILCILQDKTLRFYMILTKGGSSTSMICVCKCVSFLLWCPNLILFQKAFINWKQPLQVRTRCKANIPIIRLARMFVTRVSTRALLQLFLLGLPIALFVFHLVLFCTHNVPCYSYQGAGSMHQGTCSMLHTPSNCNMPKACLT